jgi:uncharacterized damage-inducible protein DinB
MRTSEVVVLFDYIFWMRDQLIEAVERLPAGAFTAVETVTNRDLRATLVHELDVEWSWRERLRTGAFPDADDLDPLDYDSAAKLLDHWLRDEADMREWLAGLTDADLSRPSPAEARTLPLWYFVMHLLSHAIQQFSEAAVLLTRAGASPGDLGFLEFAHERLTEGAEG